MSIYGKLSADVKVNNIQKTLDALDSAIVQALEAVGGQAEGDVAAMAPTDTALLKNSITHALEGGAPKKSSYRGDNPPKRNPTGKIPSGKYSGTASGNGDKPRSVYVGTNVKYAIFQELGSSRSGGAANGGSGFLRPAITGNLDKYVKIMKKFLETEKGI